jgi:hypothetical protein
MSPFFSFADEMLKLAGDVRLPPELRAAEHLTAPAKDWKKFEKDLKNPKVRAELTSQTASNKNRGKVDPKLRKYVRNFGGYVGTKDFVGEVQSRTSPRRWYKIKKLESGRLACGCKDWQYVRSVGSSDCIHIRALKRSGVVDGVR